ncbi:G-patch domain-containing protein [Purpureocillium lilacinum]|uniref:Protein SQS1 n=2 Tax=Purpureocillium lilacinum TaxID=33203 RepID=A0A179GMH3_PURLI|nr:G-patch domain-containing protein [Purpureocillium lilacinum]OAQ79106.1 G-patch domain-containing protein [Purpureocillium lilacinum]OAQ93140.1 G-patch domain-containing protein [Purpureocillium lilacinum]
MADEARQTSQHDHSTWSSNSRLRSQPVLFRSAGLSEPLKNDDLDQHGSDPASTQAGPPIERRAKSPDSGAEKDTVMGPDELEHAVQRSRNGADAADTGEDALFFYDLAGERTAVATSKPAIPIPERHRSPCSSSGDEIILFRGRARTRPHQVVVQPSPSQAATEQQSTAANSHEPREGITSVQTDKGNAQLQLTTGRHRRARSGRRGGRRPGHGSEEDAFLADYIANMRESGEIVDALHHYGHNSRDLGGTESDSSNQSEQNMPQARSNKRSNGRSALTSDGDAAHEEPARRGFRHELAGSANNRSDDSDAEVDDVTLAKLIAGQSLSSVSDVDDGGVCPPESDSTASASDKGPAAAQGKTADFDYMDWERPSLRPRRGKKARAPATFDVSDSELEQQLQVAWKNDRHKKKQRKQQREELRALGLLGQNPAPGDLRLKYPVGMSMQDVGAEFRVFLMGTDESRNFPPMDLHARKIIHELANQFKINSKSTGKADQRRTTLYRTVRTLSYNESKFEQALSRIHRRYLPRLDVKGKRKPGNPSATGGSGHAATSYRDGEVVGAAAPELGTSNRGRAMLEKMGWSSGTALGATHNKGILQPVTQTMKRTKAGLG